MELAAGFFALAGVALGGIVNEIRAWRDRRTADETRLFEIRRELYAKALRQIEGVASQTAQWARSDPPNDDRPFWDALTAAYETLNEIRLVARDPNVGDFMHNALKRYRHAVEHNDRALPDAHQERVALLAAFRQDLGMGG